MADSIPGADDQARKVAENRLRRAAERQGYRLAKARRRDPLAMDYGTFGLVDIATEVTVASSMSSGYGLTLAEVDAWLRTPRPRAGSPPRQHEDNEDD